MKKTQEHSRNVEVKKKKERNQSKDRIRDGQRKTKIELLCQKPYYLIYKELLDSPEEEKPSGKVSKGCKQKKMHTLKLLRNNTFQVGKNLDVV